MEDIAKLNWLPVNKNVELNILKPAHKSLYDETFPEYLKLNLHKVSANSSGSSIAPVLSIPRESGTIQHLAATIFNKLPVATRNMKYLHANRNFMPSTWPHCLYVMVFAYYLVLRDNIRAL